MLESSMRRAYLARIFFLLLLVLVPVASYVPGAWPAAQLPALRAIEIPLSLLFLAMLLFEWVNLRHKRRLLELNKPNISSRMRYLSVVLENTLPTLVIVLLASEMGLARALASPAPSLYPMLMLLTVLYLEPKLCLLAGILGAGQFALIGLIFPLIEDDRFLLTLWDPSAFHIKCLLLLTTGILTAILTLQLRKQMERSIEITRQRDHAVSIFGQHVSPQVARRLLAQELTTHSEEREACVMFFDIRNFSAYAAHRSPAEVMEYLNKVFTPMIEIVNRNQGIVNKFLGDGFMAVFGAPIHDARHSQHSVGAALEMLACLECMNEAGTIHFTRVGIGLHRGHLMTGNVGTSARKEYTLIGDTVNIASRIEQATKELDAQLLVSETLYRSLGTDLLGADDLGLRHLKGLSNPIRLYRIQ